MWNANDSNDRRTDSEVRYEAGSTPSVRKTGAEDEVIAFIGKGVEFKGVLTYKGRVRIDGRMEGEIHTDGVLLVGEEAVIAATVNAGTVISSGQITGDIVATEKVNLHAPAAMNGSVKAPVIAIEEGVFFTGSLEMTKAGQEADGSSRSSAITPIRVNTLLKAAGQ